MRLGWHELDDGMPRPVKQIDSLDYLSFGYANVTKLIPPGPQDVLPRGAVPPLLSGEPLVEHRDRAISPEGRESLVMGERAPPNFPYAWQGMRVGPLMPTIPVGASTEEWGTQWVSNRVRGLSAEGFDAFLSEYDYTMFAQRLRVKNASIFDPVVQRVSHIGHQSSVCGWQEAKLMRRYIRPDGNANQHRKGAPVA